jgi:hypothetical protein
MTQISTKRCVAPQKKPWGCVGFPRAGLEWRFVFGLPSTQNFKYKSVSNRRVLIQVNSFHFAFQEHLKIYCASVSEAGSLFSEPALLWLQDQGLDN